MFVFYVIRSFKSREIRPVPEFLYRTSWEKLYQGTPYIKDYLSQSLQVIRYSISLLTFLIRKIEIKSVITFLPFLLNKQFVYFLTFVIKWIRILSKIIKSKAKTPQWSVIFLWCLHLVWLKYNINECSWYPLAVYAAITNIKIKAAVTKR